MLYPHSRAAELPSQQGAVYEAQAPSSKSPAFSSSNGNTNHPLKVVDPNDTGDGIVSGGGTDDTANVNDNNTPVSDGIWILILVSVVYGIIRKSRINEERK